MPCHFHTLFLSVIKVSAWHACCKHGITGGSRTARRQGCGRVAGAGGLGAPAGARLLFTQSTGPIAPLNAAATDCTAPVRSLARALTAAPCIGRAFRRSVNLVMPYKA